MRISLSWIKNYVDIDKNAEEISERLSQTLSEIEDIEYKGRNLENIVVGQIVELYKHPNADKLQVTKVNIGKKVIQIVTGAPNIALNQKVPVVLTGGKAGGKEISTTDFRGIESEGMMCSQKELELGEDHNGIYILPEDTEIGMELDPLLKDEIIVIENKSLTHRPDCFSHIGIAREIAAAFSLKFEDREVHPLKFDNSKDKNLKVEIKSNKCKRYSASVVEDIKVKPSPLWLQIRLLHLGFRTVNNIVDTTNYIMLDLGQPLHAFDKSLAKNHIIVRNAKNEEKITTLDHKNRDLDETMLLITNPSEVLGIAGIMGGENSEISDTTSSIVLESANFDSSNIRSTSWKLGLHTDASLRYEKNLDPNLTIPAMAKALEMIEEFSGGVIGEVIDIYPNVVEPLKVEVDREYINSILGTKFSEKEITHLLKSIGIEDGVIPTFRRDLTSPIDIVEEVGRLYGYENLLPESVNIKLSTPHTYTGYDLEIQLEDMLLGMGVNYVHTYSFLSKELLTTFKVSLKDIPKLKNPLSENFEYLRPYIFINQVYYGKSNLSYFDRIDLFEVGSTFYNKKERKALGITLFDRDFYYIKGILETLLNNLQVKDISFNANIQDYPFLHEGKSAIIKSADTLVGFVGMLHPLITKQMDVRKDIVVAEIYLDKLIEVANLTKIYTPFSKYQSVVEDINFEIKKDQEVGNILDAIKQKNIPELKEMEIIDIFEKDDKKTVTVRVTLQSDEHTLSDREIELLKAQISKI